MSQGAVSPWDGAELAPCPAPTPAQAAMLTEDMASASAADLDQGFMARERERELTLLRYIASAGSPEGIASLVQARRMQWQDELLTTGQAAARAVGVTPMMLSREIARLNADVYATRTPEEEQQYQLLFGGKLKRMAARRAGQRARRRPNSKANVSDYALEKDQHAHVTK